MPPKLEAENEGKLDSLVDKLDNLSVRNCAKPKNFTKGQDFGQSCSIFIRYVQYNKIENEHLHIVFLSMLDNDTDMMLCNTELDSEDKKCAPAFCKIYCGILDPAATEDRIIAQLNHDHLRQESVQSFNEFALAIERVANKIGARDTMDAVERATFLMVLLVVVYGSN